MKCVYLTELAAGQVSQQECIGGMGHQVAILPHDLHSVNLGHQAGYTGGSKATVRIRVRQKLTLNLLHCVNWNTANESLTQVI